MRTHGKKTDCVKEGTFRVSFTEDRRYKTEFWIIPGVCQGGKGERTFQKERKIWTKVLS